MQEPLRVLLAILKVILRLGARDNMFPMASVGISQPMQL